MKKSIDLYRRHATLLDMFLSAATTAVPAYQYSQEEILHFFLAQYHGALDADFIRQVFANAGVSQRAFVLSIAQMAALGDFAERMAMFPTMAAPLLQQAARGAMERARIAPADIDGLAIATTTGFLTPTLDAMLLAPLGLAPTTRRLPLVGLGCAAGVSGLADAIAWGRGNGCRRILFGAVELASLAYQREDVSKRGCVAAALFGDGAAAVLCEADTAVGWEWIGSASVTAPGTEAVMGWRMHGMGLDLVLAPNVPVVVSGMAHEYLSAILQRYQLRMEDITTWICHPGGPKVIEALRTIIPMCAEDADRIWHGLAAHGNMSACSILYSLAEHLDRPATHGDTTCLLAFGPGFSMEVGVLRYRCTP